MVSDVLVLCTAWPLYLEVPVEDILSALAQPLVLDPAGRLATSLSSHPDVCYVRVGASLARSASQPDASLSEVAP